MTLNIKKGKLKRKKLSSEWVSNPPNWLLSVLNLFYTVYLSFLNNLDSKLRQVKGQLVLNVV